jgi:hypothetical protein
MKITTLATIITIASVSMLPVKADWRSTMIQPTPLPDHRPVWEPEQHRVDGLTRDGQYVQGAVTNGYTFNGTVNGLGRYCTGAGCQYW